jgi:two-component system sensor histidine kinase DegS
MAPEVRTPPGPAREAEAEVIRLDRELSEIERLIGQAGEESTRHEARRVQAEERMASLATGEAGGGENLREAIDGLITATRRAWLMESQIEVLEGKQRTLARFRDRLLHYADVLAALPEGPAVDDLGQAAGSDDSEAAPTSAQVLETQEMLRRDIARAMHDGPAQSLTNIALQTQIVERVLSRDPGRAVAEVDELLRMVRKTLEETKTFIFDIRPMVLDDLGLVPTLRRAARDRGRQGQVPIDLDSRGHDRRLGTDLESSLFRVLDDAIIGYLAANPARITIRLGWGDSGLRAEVRSAPREEALVEIPVVAEATPQPEPEQPEADDDLPPALAAMIMERRAAAAVVTDAAAGAAADAAAAAGSLPAAAWKAIKARVSFGKISVELYDGGRLLVAEVAYPA